MRALLVALVLLSGCLAPGNYRVTLPARHATAVAISTHQAVTVLHPIRVGDELELEVWGGRAHYAVTAILDPATGLVKVQRVGDGPDLEHGHSGSPFRDAEGVPRALLVGGR